MNTQLIQRSDLEHHPQFKKQSPMIRDAMISHVEGVALMGDAREKFVISEIAKASTRCGQNEMPGERYFLLRKDLEHYIQSNCATWKADQLSNAFRDGAMRDPDRSLTIGTFIRWIKHYDEHVRRIALHELRSLDKKKEREEFKVSELSSDKRKAFIRSAFDRWKKGNKKGLSVVYDYLTEEKLIEISVKERWRYIYESAEALTKSLKEQNEGMMMSFVRIRMHQIKGIKENEPLSVPDFVKVEAQTRIVEDYFRTL